VTKGLGFQGREVSGDACKQRLLDILRFHRHFLSFRAVSAHGVDAQDRPRLYLNAELRDYCAADLGLESL
jgi:hypothetical protein